MLTQNKTCSQKNNDKSIKPPLINFKSKRNIVFLGVSDFGCQASENAATFFAVVELYILVSVVHSVFILSLCLACFVMVNL